MNTTRSASEGAIVVFRSSDTITDRNDSDLQESSLDNGKTKERAKRNSARLSVCIKGNPLTSSETLKKKKKVSFSLKPNLRKGASRIADQLVALGAPLQKKEIENLYQWVKPLIRKLCKDSKTLPFNLMPTDSEIPCDVQCHSKDRVYLVFDSSVQGVKLGEQGNSKTAIRVWNLMKAEAFAYLMEDGLSTAESIRNSWLNELRLIPILNTLENVVRNYMHFEDNLARMIFINELFDADLLTVMNNHIKHIRELTQDDKERILLQILKGLKMLHRAKIIHRDIKPENILIAFGKQIRVAYTDFGFSCFFYEKKQLRDLKGSLPYLAPECLLEEGRLQSFASDVYAAGTIAYLLTHGKVTPWFGYLQEKKYVDGIVEMRHYSAASPSKIGPTEALIRKMLAYNVEERISSDNAYSEYHKLCKMKWKKRARSTTATVKKNQTHISDRAEFKQFLEEKKKGNQQKLKNS